ncbi:MAG TPA: extracellular solute-binding protein [Propionicimonas sp.]|jgi:ABC-type glycerol-3-phosphate transport system substrate-binding protein
MRRKTSRFGAAAVAAAAGLVLVACSGQAAASGPTATTSAAPTVDTTAPVTISISDLPTTENQKARDGVLAKVKAFEAKNPNITVNATEATWAANTFQAMLAGGTMPTVMSLPFTEIGSLMQRNQVADVTDYLQKSPVLKDLNPSLVSKATDSSGRVRGVPIAAYPMGLLYNRALFTKAGLDPDKPPTTWDEVRTDAKAIQEKAGVQGFGAMTTNNTGGWVLAATSYGFGGKLVSDDGKTATVNNPATKQVLEYYKSLRWDDNTMGSNFLLNWGDASKLFASGQLGMFVQGADLYSTAVVNLKMDKDAFGLAPLPQGPNGIGTLTGGNFVVFNPSSTPEQITAGLKWVAFNNYGKYQDKDTAVQQATTDLGAGGVVGAPEMRLVSADQYNQWLGWVGDKINVPRDHFTAYFNSIGKLPLVPEPAPSGQEIYAALDPVVQAVLTQKDANIDKLLTDAQTNVQGILDGAQK